jgi:hypothetical protein
MEKFLNIIKGWLWWNVQIVIQKLQI